MKLMGNHTIEDIMEYACPHRFDNNFLIKMSKFRIKNKVLYGDVKNGDEFYGIVDGINEKDIFIPETPETQKFYFKVTDLRPTQTYLELISEAGNIAFKDGHTVRIVEGL
jgi:hypothetical protein